MSDGRKAKTSRRSRVNYTPAQLSEMEQIFEQSQYPDPLVLESLSERANIPVHNIMTWFQNRRSKFRRDSKKGHINWMRNHLYDQSRSHSPDVATSPGHVLSSANSTSSPDDRKPSANVQHHPVEQQVQQPNQTSVRPELNASFLTPYTHTSTLENTSFQNYGNYYSLPSFGSPEIGSQSSNLHATSPNTSGYYSSPEHSAPSCLHTPRDPSPELDTSYPGQSTCYYSPGINTSFSSGYQSPSSYSSTPHHPALSAQNYTAPISWLMH